jgi:hypothetical protein
MSQNFDYYCFPSVAASATATTDAVNKGGYLNINTANALAITPAALRNFPIPLLGVKNGTYKAYAAEVLRIVVVTPTAANNTDYRLVLSADKGQAFDNNLPQEIQAVFQYTSTASASRLAIVNAFVAAINAHPFWTTRVVATQTGGAGTETLTVTAKAGFPIFSLGVGANLSASISTAGSPQIGATGAQLLATGYFNATNGLPVSGTNYSALIFESYSGTEAVASGTGDTEKSILYIVDGGNNANLILGLSALLVK